MIAKPIDGKREYKAFAKVIDEVYQTNQYFRGTESSVEKILICGPTKFHQHSRIHPYLLQVGNEIVGRFALIKDEKLQSTIQVSFFEALPNLDNIVEIIKGEIYRQFPDCTNYVIGLNGHLNYGAGILINQFNQVPVFGFPYSQAYYLDYFRDLHIRKLFSYRLPIDSYIKWSESYSRPRKKEGLTLRFLDKKHIKRDIAIYTRLNNKSFKKHPYWANRTVEEDLELFYPFRFLLKNENMVIAEYRGEPVGFFLWYPDFNQLVNSQRDLNAIDVIRYRLGKSIDTCRFTEIGVLPKFHGSPIALSLMDKAIPYIKKGGFKYCEVGFIFEENRPSIALCKRILTRCQLPSEPHRHFALFEGNL